MQVGFKDVNVSDASKNGNIKIQTMQEKKKEKYTKFLFNKKKIKAKMSYKN